MKPIHIAAANAEEASRRYAAQRDFSGQGASTFPDGAWQGKHISYNGRVWDSVDDWQADVAPFYCPSTGYRDKDPATPPLAKSERDRVTIAAFYAARAAREGRE